MINIFKMCKGKNYLIILLFSIWKKYETNDSYLYIFKICITLILMYIKNILNVFKLILNFINMIYKI